MRFFAAEIVGVAGLALVLRSADDAGLVVLAFGPPGNSLARDALRALGCAVGDAVRCIGRLRSGAQLAVDMLAVELGDRVPAEWAGTANLGLDKLTAERLKTERAVPLLVELGDAPAEPFASVRRRLGQVMLGGWSVLTPGVLAAVRSEAAELDAMMARHAGAVLRSVEALPAPARLAWFGRAWLASGPGAP